MKAHSSFFLPLALMAASTIVSQDDILGQFPDCAQSCVQNVLLQHCPLDQTLSCFCTTQVEDSLNFLFQCFSGIGDLSCDRDTSWTVAAELCWEYPVISNGNWTSEYPPPLPTGWKTTSTPTAGPRESHSLTGHPFSTHTQSSGGSGGARLSNGVIIGITISAVVALGIAAGLIMFIFRIKHPRPLVFEPPIPLHHQPDKYSGLTHQNYPPPQPTPELGHMQEYGELPTTTR